ncbi:uncharacterized protein [Haliotis asinina]|uniref:uncharacterized protein n=1 Tax=Haliotis asinina TaxID=109174 RepID=UPI003532616F
MAHAFSASLTVFLLVWIDGVWNEEIDLSRVVCQSGWERYGAGECIWLSDSTATFDTAEKSCLEKGGQLLTLQTEQKEQFVNNITRRKGREFWIGLLTTSNYYNPQLRWKDGAHNTFRLRHSNFVGSFTPNTCGYLGRAYNEWMNTGTCSEERQFICQKPSACLKGWFGEKCEKQCHCLEEHCPRGSGECSQGCHIGWHGPQCFQPVATPEALFYCFNSKVRGKYMLLRINPKSMHYNVIGAIDRDGVSVDGCDKTSFILDDRGVFSRVINVTDGDKNPCGGIVTKDGDWQWTFRVQEFPGLLSRADIDIVVKCNFSNADTLSRHDGADIDGIVDTVVKTLVETKEEVKLLVINPVTLEKVNKVQLGSNVILKLAIDTKPGSGARGVSAYNCEAYTSDGMYTKQLTDKYGCAASGSPVSGVNASVTAPFPIFTFPGHSSVNFRCQYDYCFRAEFKCINRCRFFRRRGKRSENADPGVRKPVFTTVAVLQDDEQGKTVRRLEVLPSEDKSRASPFLYLNPITCSLFLFLLTVFLMLHVFFVRSLKKTVEDMKVDLVSHNRSQRFSLL